MITEDGKHVTIPGTVVWDGITNPETNDSGKLRHSCKIAFHPQIPEGNEALGLATAELQSSEWKGVLPPGARFAIANVQPNELMNLFPGFNVMNAGTYNGAPQVYDINGQELNSMQYGQLLYPGAQVELLVHFFAYNNKSKGIAASLDGIKILDATAPRLQLGAGINPATVFGNGQPAVPGQIPGAVPGQMPGAVPAGNNYLNPQ